MIYCTACGKQYSPNAVSCVNCGEPNISIKSKQKSMTTALILCILLGSMGIHRFYLGKIGTGVIMLILFIFYMLLIYPIVVSQLLYSGINSTWYLSFLTYIWVIIDAFRIGTRNMKDGKGNNLI